MASKQASVRVSKLRSRGLTAWPLIARPCSIGCPTEDHFTFELEVSNPFPAVYPRINTHQKKIADGLCRRECFFGVGVPETCMTQQGAFRSNCVIRSLRSITSSATLLGDMSMQLLSRCELQPTMQDVNLPDCSMHVF